MTGFLRAHGYEIARLTFEHLWLTLFAMLLATVIGLPLGIVLSRRPKLAKPIIGFANVLQTVPSLALFGLLLPVPWLGENAARLAILALTGYALLPILRNTYAGIRSIDPTLTDIATALGMTARWRGESVAIIRLPCKPIKPIVFVQVMFATWLADAKVLGHWSKLLSAGTSC